MNAKEMWAACGGQGSYEAWSFGGDGDALARLVLEGRKTATASAHALYEAEGCPLPKEGDVSVILDSREEALCIIRTTHVAVLPFRAVSPRHAWLEGEGDRSLAHWRKVHRAFFEEELKALGQPFTQDMLVVCEEFEKVYPPD